MHIPKARELNVFLSGVSHEFKGEKENLKHTLDEYLGLSVYCSEADNEPDFAEAWPKLKKEIESSHIFALFIGVEFGSPSDKEDISVTQKEYELARDLKKPIIVFTTGNIYRQIEDERQRRFCNQVTNSDKDGLWVPSLKGGDIQDVKKLSEYMMEYVFLTAADALPVLNNEDEAGNFYVKISIISRSRALTHDPDNNEVDILMTIMIQNRDKYGHYVDAIWLEKFGRKHKLTTYDTSHYTGGMNINNSPIKIEKMDKVIYRTTIKVRTPKDFDIDEFREELEKDFRSCLPIKCRCLSV
ncbi:MAG: DUF4062 domain-containing protein [Candidatus Altiarchaeota archaeon]|nr:DUF4062 domain-containing protein [Candidatus Altiarchaeota archaeon]